MVTGYDVILSLYSHLSLFRQEEASCLNLDSEWLNKGDEHDSTYQSCVSLIVILSVGMMDRPIPLLLL